MKKKMNNILRILIAVSLLMFLAACASKPKFTVTNLYAKGIYHDDNAGFFMLSDLNVNGTCNGETMTITGTLAFAKYEIVAYQGDIGVENAAGGATITNFRITLKDKDDPNAKEFEIVMNEGDSFELFDPSFPALVFGDADRN